MATLEQVRVEIYALSDAELKKLKNYADFQAKCLGRHSRGVSGQDLLNSAIVSALDGTRNWNPNKTDFMGFMRGAVDSIGNNWKTSSDISQTISDPGFSDPEAGFVSNFENAKSPKGTDDSLELEGLIESIKSKFPANQSVASVVDGLVLGLTAKEMQEKMGLSRHQYDYAIRLIRENTSWLNGDSNEQR